jgi:hypothetical protein
MKPVMSNETLRQAVIKELDEDPEVIAKHIWVNAIDGAVTLAREVERLEPAMTNEAKDRHVLAAAVAADSELIVTFNLDDFPPEACEPVGVEAIHPDDFLLDLNDLAPDAVRAALERQAADLHPPWPLEQLLDALTTAGVPRFAETIRSVS